MGKILDYIQESGKGKYYCYKTKKFSLDNDNSDTLTYDDKPALLTKSSQIAETDLSRVHTVWRKTIKHTIAQCVKCVTSFSLFLYASVGIEPLRFFNIVPCKYNDIPPSRCMGAPLLEAEAVHAEGDLLGRERPLHRIADKPMMCVAVRDSPTSSP